MFALSSLVLLAACTSTWLAPEAADAEAGQQICSSGRHCNPIEVPSLPFTHRGDTRSGADRFVDVYSCAPTTDESGAEDWFVVELDEAGTLTAKIDEVSGDGIDVDVHVLDDVDPDACLARGHAEASATLAPGVYYVVVDTWVNGSGVEQDGPYRLDLTFRPAAAPLEACYPSGCLPVVEVSPGSGYSYPSPLSGSAQYSRPVRYLDLDAIHPDTRLSPNFALDELAQEWKGRYAVVQVHAIERLQAVREDVGGLVVNSGYRSPGYNGGVGGATYSRHMYGDGFDLDPSSVSLGTLADACYEQGASFVQLYSTHVHCDWRDDPLDPAFYGAYRSASWVGEVPHLDAELLWAGDALVAPAEGWDEGEPLREWTAFAADGSVLAEATADTFVPPTDAVRVEVVVGRALVRTIER